MIISGQATPNSAMSISPATSEICSILDNGNISGKKYNTTTTIPSKHKIKQSSKKHNRDNRENNRSQIKNSSNHVGLVTERSDLDLDWRGTGVGTGNTTPEIPASAPSSGSGGGQQQNSRNYWQKTNQKSSSSGNGNTSSNVIQINQESKETSRPLSADEDTNWRDHRNKPLTENNSSWRTIQSKSKNRKIQGKGKFFKDSK